MGIICPKIRHQILIKNRLTIGENSFFGPFLASFMMTNEAMMKTSFSHHFKANFLLEIALLGNSFLSPNFVISCRCRHREIKNEVENKIQNDLIFGLNFDFGPEKKIKISFWAGKENSKIIENEPILA